MPDERRTTTSPNEVRVHLDRPGIGFGASGVVEVVAHSAELRVEVQVGGHAVVDADLDPARRRLGDDHAARDLVEAKTVPA